MPITRLLLLALVLAAAMTTPAPASDDDFLVHVSSEQFGFGAFRSPTGGAAPMRIAFGEPDRRIPDRRTGGCTLKWRALGFSARFTDYGQPDIRPCWNGYFREAVLRDWRWHTGRGVRPGSPAAAARRASRRRCTVATCGENGYALGLARSECAVGRFPTVIARVGRGRVTALVVRSRGCE